MRRRRVRREARRAVSAGDRVGVAASRNPRHPARLPACAPAFRVDRGRRRLHAGQARARAVPQGGGAARPRPGRRLWPLRIRAGAWSRHARPAADDRGHDQLSRLRAWHGGRDSGVTRRADRSTAIAGLRSTTLRDPLVVDTAVRARPRAARTWRGRRWSWRGSNIRDLDPAHTLDVLDRIGREAARRLARVQWAFDPRADCGAQYLVFEDEGLRRQPPHYDDYRNSLLNVVIDRRLGIPITLALVYSRSRARGARGGGRLVSRPFPHARARPRRRGEDDEHPARSVRSRRRAGSGRLPSACSRHAGDDVPFDPSLVRPCTRRTWLTRMLNNLKRTYVEMRSFAQARRVTDLLLAVDPPISRSSAIVGYSPTTWMISRPRCGIWRTTCG